VKRAEDLLHVVLHLKLALVALHACYCYCCCEGRRIHWGHDWVYNGRTKTFFSEGTSKKNVGFRLV